MTLEEWKFNEQSKRRPVVSTDCRFNDHAGCEGFEAALWPDGELSVRQCSCVCHMEATKC